MTSIILTRLSLFVFFSMVAPQTHPPGVICCLDLDECYYPNPQTDGCMAGWKAIPCRYGVISEGFDTACMPNPNP